MKKIKKVIKKYLPLIFQVYRKWRPHQSLIQRQLESLPARIKAFYFKNENVEIVEILEFLEKNEVRMIPYDFTKDYNLNDIKVYVDEILNLPYIIFENKSNNSKHKIYFPSSYNTLEIQNAVLVSLLEQHEKSPHRYLTKSFNINSGDSAVLAGASDCIFCISIIDNFKKIYLFEPDEKWVEPMRASLQPFQNKVEVVHKYIGDRDSVTTIKLDTFFKDKADKISYIQADIEGAEAALLRGAEKLFKNSPGLKTSLCCYHTKTQEKELTKLLHKYKLTTTTSYGYLILCSQYPLKKPYLRRGVIYAKKPMDA